MILAALFPLTNGKTVAQLLIGNSTVPVYYFRVSNDDVYITANLATDFPEVRFIEPGQFRAEIDYRVNFGEPSDGTHWKGSAISKDELIAHFEQQQQKAAKNPWLEN